MTSVKGMRIFCRCSQSPIVPRSRAADEPRRPPAPSLSRPKGATQPVDARGFIRRWLVLEPIARGGRLTESEVQEALQSSLPGVHALPTTAISSTMNGRAEVACARHQLIQRQPVSLRVGALETDVERAVLGRDDGGFAAGDERRAAGHRFELGVELVAEWRDRVITLYDDRQTVIDDGVSNGVSPCARGAM